MWKGPILLGHMKVMLYVQEFMELFYLIYVRIKRAIFCDRQYVPEVLSKIMKPLDSVKQPSYEQDFLDMQYIIF